MRQKSIFIAALTAFILNFYGFNSEARKRRVLFIGNSYVTTNNLPAMIAAVANSQGDTLVYDLNAPGGTTLSGHFNSAVTRAKIALGGWDLVVIQAQSQEPAFPDNQVATQTLPFALKLDSLIHAVDSCTETQFYMTWGRKNGDASNCGFYPPICTYFGMQDKLSERYLKMAQITKGSVAPVGEAWRKMVTTHPSVELYVSDQSHPIVPGTYLAALVFYQTLFQKPLSNTIYKPTGLADSTVGFLQNAAKTTVQDSLKKWFQHGKLAKANFEFQAVGTQVHFRNASYAAQNYFWDFGDGLTSALPEPLHQYGQSGTYNVSLTAKSGCKTDNVEKTILVQPTALAPLSNSGSKLFPVPFKDDLQWEVGPGFDLNGLLIRDMQGKKVFQSKHPSHLVSVGFLPRGTYLIQLTFTNGTYENRLILKE